MSAVPALAVVVPVKDEEDNIVPLIEEIAAALDGVVDYEIVYVNDGSSDGTLARLCDTRERRPRLRFLSHETACGQSTAVRTGVRNARAPLIATLDGDGQNDPADIPALLGVWHGADDPDLLLVAGHRAKRKDTPFRRFQSRLANRVRGGLLGDDTPDSGCGLKVFSRAAFLALPYFDHMHRFLPALMIRHGGTVVSVPISHRDRERGTSKYGAWNRLWVGIVDLFGVMWLQSRAKVAVVRPENDAETPR